MYNPYDESQIRMQRLQRLLSTNYGYNASGLTRPSGFGELLLNQLLCGSDGRQFRVLV